MTVGFESYYTSDTTDTPKALLVSVAAYVFCLLAVVVTLLTRPNPALRPRRRKRQKGNPSETTTTGPLPGTDDAENDSQALGSSFNVAAAGAAASGEEHGNNNNPQRLNNNNNSSNDNGVSSANSTVGSQTTAPTSAALTSSTRVRNSSSSGENSNNNPQQQRERSRSNRSQKISSNSNQHSKGEVEMTTTPTLSAASLQQQQQSMPKVQPRQPPSSSSPFAPNHHHHNPATTTTRTPSVASTSRLRKSQKSQSAKPKSGGTNANNNNTNANTIDNNSNSTNRDEPLSTRPQGAADAETGQAGTTTEEGAAEAADFPRPLRSWDLLSSATVRFRHGHFSGRSVQRLVQQERAAQDVAVHNEGHSSYSQGGGSSYGSWNSRATSGMNGPARSAMSHTASQVLEAQTVEGEAEYYRQRYVQKSQAQRQQQQSQAQLQQSASAQQHSQQQMSNASLRRIPFRRGPSSAVSRTSSGRSRMRTLDPDVLSPHDAADAFDPGTSLPETLEDEDAFPPVGAAPSIWGNLLDLAEPDPELRRILWLAAPSTLGAVAEPCFRLGLVAIISHFLDTDSMVAFVLVILFVRITTEELSGAITDAESSLLHQALSLGGDQGFVLAGRHVQLAMLLQLLIGIPVLAAWAFVMDPIVSWLIPENDRVGHVAQQYAAIIAVDYAMQMTSRAFMLVFHMTGQATPFELQIDLTALGVTLVAIALYASLDDEPSLNWIGGIQVMVGAAKIAVKIAIVSCRGLLQPYRKGLLGSLSLLDRQSVWAFCGTTIPLLLGSLIELREWEILVLFTRHLGGAEVATWALMGIVWEIFEASTEGLGEAAAVRVSLVLSENLADLARQLAHKAVLLGILESLLITSLFWLLGRNLSVALTDDATLQTLFNELVGMTGLANVSMSLAQVYWSLLGAQGRFGAASSAILLCRWLLTMPLAAVYIFAATYDLRSVASALAVGYMTSTVILAWRLHQSDWKLYAQLARDEAMALEDDNDADVGLLDGEEDGDEEEEDEDDDDDDDFDFDDGSSDSTGFG